VGVLYACESGSRAWGFASPDSDWDVRFIYLHASDWYLSLIDWKEVIELPIEGNLDINGWDFRKSLKLLLKGNPVLFEWLASPIVYREDQTVMVRYRELAQHLFRPRRAFQHYLSMARRNFQDLQGETVRLKKYLYVLRPILACRWIEQERGQPPMLFESLLDASQMRRQLRTEVDNLLARKRAGEELAEAPRQPAIHRFISTELERLTQVGERFVADVLNREHIAQLETFYRSVLRGLYAKQ
jgi:uncharacterized protein